MAADTWTLDAAIEAPLPDGNRGRSESFDSTFSAEVLLYSNVIRDLTHSRSKVGGANLPDGLQKLHNTIATFCLFRPCSQSQKKCLARFLLTGAFAMCCNVFKGLIDNAKAHINH